MQWEGNYEYYINKNLEKEGRRPGFRLKREREVTAEKWLSSRILKQVPYRLDKVYIVTTSTKFSFLTGRKRDKETGGRVSRMKVIRRKGDGKGEQEMQWE